MEFYISQAISALTTLIAIWVMQCKNMKIILIGQTMINLLVAISYFLLDGLSGAGICFIAIFQGIWIYFYTGKEKKVPLYLVVGFLVLYIACSIVYYKSAVDLVTAAAALCYAMSIVQQKPALSRLWYLPNPLLWCIYDWYEDAYVNLIMHLIVFASALLGILRLDRKK